MKWPTFSTKTIASRHHGIFNKSLDQGFAVSLADEPCVGKTSCPPPKHVCKRVLVPTLCTLYESQGEGEGLCPLGLVWWQIGKVRTHRATCRHRILHLLPHGAPFIVQSLSRMISTLVTSQRTLLRWAFPQKQGQSIPSAQIPMIRYFIALATLTKSGKNGYQQRRIHLSLHGISTASVWPAVAITQTSTIAT